MSFELDIRRFAERTNRDADKTVRAVLTSLTDLVISPTPVDTGRARGNWQATVDAPASGTLERLDPTGEIAKAAAETAIITAPGRVFFLSNNVPYISELEYGSSKQAPNGMVRRAILEIKKIIK